MEMGLFRFSGWQIEVAKKIGENNGKCRDHRIFFE
jgi:hypothetical protein